MSVVAASIEKNTGNLAVVFEEINCDEPVAPISECRENDLTPARPLTVKVAFQNRETGESREQSVFMGDFPWMTDWGTFIINGTDCFFQAEDGIRAGTVTGVQTCALPIWPGAQPLLRRTRRPARAG